MESRPVHRIALLGVAAAGALLANASGCGGATSSSVCDAICDCEECTNDAYEDCVDDIDDIGRRAEHAECSDKMDAYLGCVDANLQCVDRRVEVSNCDVEHEELDACAQGVPSLGGSCEAGAKKLLECLGVMIDPGSVENCSGATQCTLTCYANASCEELQMGGSKELNACLSSCPIQPTDPGGVPR